MEGKERIHPRNLIKSSCNFCIFLLIDVQNLKIANEVFFGLVLRELPLGDINNSSASQNLQAVRELSFGRFSLVKWSFVIIR